MCTHQLVCSTKNQRSLLFSLALALALVCSFTAGGLDQEDDVKSIVVRQFKSQAVYTVSWCSGSGENVAHSSHFPILVGGSNLQGHIIFHYYCYEANAASLAPMLIFFMQFQSCIVL